MLIAQGGAFGGLSLYLDAGRPAYCYNLFGITCFRVEGADPLPAGDHQRRMEFAYDGGGFGNGGTATLYLDGERVAEGRVDATVSMIFSVDEAADVGKETGAWVSERYTPEGSRFRARSSGSRSTRRRGRSRGPPEQAPENGCTSRWHDTSQSPGLRRRRPASSGRVRSAP